MFEKLSKPGRTKNITAYIIFGAICLVFAFFGIAPDRFGNQSVGGAAAIVNEYVISLNDFRERVQRVEQQFSSESVPETQRQSFAQMVRRRALEELISLEVLAQAAKKQGVRATDPEVMTRIVDIPAFQEEGVFKRDRYNQYLGYSRISSSDFEEKVRKEIVITRMQSLFVRAAQPVAGEVLKDQEVTDTKIKLKYVGFDLDLLAKNMPIDKKELTDYLKVKENQDRVKSYYDSNQMEFSLPEEVKARHILIRPNTELKRTDGDAKKLVNEIRKRLEKEDFAKLAKEFSDDPISQKNGGDLGYFSKGRMVPEFENVAFNLEIGKLSDVVKTQFGYHILKVEDKKAAKVLSFDEVRDAIARSQIAKTRVTDKVKEIETLVKESKRKELDSLLKSFTLEWQESGDFDFTSNTVPGLGENDKVITSLIRRGQTLGLLPELIESQGKYYLLSVDEVTLPKEQAAHDKKQGQMIAYRRSGEILNSWIRKEREHSAIKRNQQLLLVE